MSFPRLASVNVGNARTLEHKPLLVSAIDKLPARGTVEVGGLGLAGDEVGNPKLHGGTYQAVYAYASEDLQWWTDRLGRYVRPGLFGENLTTLDVDLNACVVGEQWLVGTARFQVSSVRTPCATFERWMGLQGFDATSWNEQFARAGRAGVYLSVLDRGWVQEGDMVDGHRPALPRPDDRDDVPRADHGAGAPPAAPRGRRPAAARLRARAGRRDHPLSRRTSYASGGQDPGTYPAVATVN